MMQHFIVWCLEEATVPEQSLFLWTRLYMQDVKSKEGVKNCSEVTNSNPHSFRPLKLSVLHTGTYCAVWLISQFL